MNLYDFTVRTQTGEELSLSSLKGKAVLVVNTATECGFTPQYEELQRIYETYRDRGLEILDFPCNQFGQQAPGADSEIKLFCSTRFGITFPQFAKIEVLGEHASELFQWLCANTRFEGFEGPAKLILGPIVKKMDRDYKNNGNIKWNFTKFLIDRNGEIAARYEPTAPMDRIREGIEAVL